MIDLRSDTVTLPTPAMRRAMADAEVGDDVYGEDPTINRLEQIGAAAVGKPAAVFVASGTMGNLIAILAHCPRGMKAIVGSMSHSNLYEAGGASALGGVVLAPIPNTPEGEIDLELLAAELGQGDDPHFAEPALIALENTHNRCGGEAVPLAHMAKVADMARSRGLPVHLDGARIFNAALALEATPRQIAEHADSVSFCLSKGLAAPVGSLLCGSADFAGRARRLRKVLGGGMRQAGIVAAAGIVALEEMVDRLAEDHRNAQTLAEGLARIGGIRVQPAKRRTNMVFFEVEGGAYRANRFEAALKDAGVLISPRSPAVFRAVTHYGIGAADIQHAIGACAETAQALRAN
ncbi:MAG: low-specificity L-threonine aldolase [Candidatus Binataceae bacterium]